MGSGAIATASKCGMYIPAHCLRAHCTRRVYKCALAVKCEYTCNACCHEIPLTVSVASLKGVFRCV